MILEKIDQWIVDRAQDVVDLSQKKPAWWVGNLAIFFTMVCFLRLAFDDITYFTLVVNSLLGIVLVASSRSDALIGAIGTANILRVLIAVTGLAAIILGKSIGVTLSEIAMCGCYYFSACKPPKPRKKVEKPKLAFNR